VVVLHIISGAGFYKALTVNLLGIRASGARRLPISYVGFRTFHHRPVVVAYCIVVINGSSQVLDKAFYAYPVI